MLAWVVTIRVKPEKMEECVSTFGEMNAPSIAARPGFDRGHWWEDRVGGQAASATFWENEEDERASRANVPRLVEEMSHLLAWDEAYQETFEVVYEQYPVERSEEASPTYTLPSCRAQVSYSPGSPEKDIVGSWL